VRLLAQRRDLAPGEHGGRIGFETAAGAGTTFIVDLPLVDG